MRKFAVALLVVLTVLAGGAATAVAAPGAISGLTSTGSFTFTWQPVAGIAGYAYSFDRSPDTSGGTTVALAPLSFSSSQLTAGGAPWQVASGDFGNGHVDLAVLDQGSNSVTVLLGNGHGVFTKGNTYATGSNPHSIIVGDFNGDGRPDLAVANWSDNTVSVLLATGVGTFAAKVDYPTGINPHGLAAGDLGNGTVDLVVANASSNTISVFIGDGDGTFQPRVDYPAGAHPEKIVIRDFNGDGHPDLAEINNVGNTVSILLGAGDGTSLPASSRWRLRPRRSSVRRRHCVRFRQIECAVGRMECTEALRLRDEVRVVYLSSQPVAAYHWVAGRDVHAATAPERLGGATWSSAPVRRAQSMFHWP